MGNAHAQRMQYTIHSRYKIHLCDKTTEGHENETRTLNMKEPRKSF